MKEAFARLECVEVSKDKVSVEERQRNYLALTKASAEDANVAWAMWIAFCRRKMLVRIYNTIRLDLGRPCNMWEGFNFELVYTCGLSKFLSYSAFWRNPFKTLLDLFQLKVLLHDFSIFLC